MVHKWCTLFEFTIPSVHSTYTLYSNYNRHKDACMVYKWCVLLEFNIQSAYAHIYRPHNTHSTDIWMHTWRTSYAQCLNPLSQVYILHTLNTQTTIDIRMHTWFAGNARSSSPLSPVNISTHTPRFIQPAIDIKMHASFTSHEHCSIS